MRKGTFVLLFCGIVSPFGIRAFADVTPSALFSDHAVLQAGMTVPVWGKADPGERVTVAINKQKRSTFTGADGRWVVKLKGLKPGGPYDVTISGKNSITIHDVLIGEVWLGSGQSNMVFTVSKRKNPWAGLQNEDAVIAAANYPQIRMFTGETAKTLEPQNDIKGEWKLCTPENVPDFSAVGYFFARDLHQALKVPIGILTMAYGASTAEAWVPRDTLIRDSELKPLVDRLDARVAYYRQHPGATDENAPPAPQTINAHPRKPGPMHDPVQDQHEPTVLYNGMIHPIIPYAIRGILWYQGESIVGGRHGVELYPHIMEALVKEWRREWGEGNIPFNIVQLAALKNVSNNPSVREAQSGILSLPNTAMAVTIDIGDPTNVHPKNKEPLGDRLARIALAKTYKHKIEFSGPAFHSMKVEGSSIRITFSHARGGLIAQNGDLHWFQIAGSDQKFVDAKATIQGKSVIVNSPEVKQPVAVRYAWASYPANCNLYNSEGLPAAPFRTDKWDVLAEDAVKFSGQ